MDNVVVITCVTFASSRPSDQTLDGLGFPLALPLLSRRKPAEGDGPRVNATSAALALAIKGLCCADVGVGMALPIM